jgi:hypothetical protein
VGSSRSNSPLQRHAQQRQQPQQHSPLQAAAAQELAGPLPNDLDFLVCFALPAICFMPRSSASSVAL